MLSNFLLKQNFKFYLKIHAFPENNISSISLISLLEIPRNFPLIFTRLSCSQNIFGHIKRLPERVDGVGIGVVVGVGIISVKV